MVAILVAVLLGCQQSGYQSYTCPTTSDCCAGLICSQFTCGVVPYYEDCDALAKPTPPGNECLNQSDCSDCRTGHGRFDPPSNFYRCCSNLGQECPLLPGACTVTGDAGLPSWYCCDQSAACFNGNCCKDKNVACLVDAGAVCCSGVCVKDGNDSTALCCATNSIAPHIGKGLLCDPAQPLQCCSGVCKLNTGGGQGPFSCAAG